MGLRDIQAGTKTAKAIAARFIESKGGKPGIEVAFKFQEGENFEQLNWVGWLTEKAMEYTMDTLTNVLDSDGNDAVDGNGVFTSPTFINTKKEVSLVVEMEAGVNADGTEKVNEQTGEVIYYPRIKWVNNLGGSAYSGCTPDVVKQQLAATGFRAAFLHARKASGKPVTEKQPANIPNHAPTSNPPF